MNERIDLNSPKIVFRKWTDYTVDADFDDDDDEFEEDEDEGYQDKDHGPLALLKTVHMGGPMSAIGDINKLFNLWVCSTNFVISDEMMVNLDDTLGVESLDLLSPYKIRVGIGELFDPLEIRLNIASTLKNCLANV